MARQTYGAQELGDLLGVSQSKAYQFIRTMNNELKEKGFLTVRGKVPAAYVQKRFFGVVAAGEEETDNRLHGFEEPPILYGRQAVLLC